MMTGNLPAGIFKGLARVVGPLCLWMIAGWALYPSFIDRITVMAGESVIIEEIQMLSYAMIAACAAAGIFLIIYGYTGPAPADAEIDALEQALWPCPRCLRPQPADAEICEHCGKFIER